MDAALTFLLKLLGTGARIGTVIALTAFALCLLVQAQVQPFPQLAGTTLYQTVIVAGVVGFSIVVVEIFIALYRLINEWSKRKLLFIEQPGGFWTYIERDGLLRLQAVLHVTNKNFRVVIISRPQLSLPSFARRRVWQRCGQLTVGDEVYLPGSDAAPIKPRTLSIVVVQHSHRMAKPRSRSVVFLFEFRDQWKRRHRTRLHLQPLPPDTISVSRGRMRPEPVFRPRQPLDIGPGDVQRREQS
jgi:hypothetical protein